MIDPEDGVTPSRLKARAVFYQAGLYKVKLRYMQWGLHGKRLETRY